jgi:hypothetical protein
MRDRFLEMLSCEEWSDDEDRNSQLIPTERETSTVFNEMRSNYSELFEQQIFTDVTFKFQDGEIKAHKAILSCKRILNIHCKKSEVKHMKIRISRPFSGFHRNVCS